MKNPGENLLNLARKIGYFFLKQERDELSFIKPLERSGYPRFHLYLKQNSENREIIFNLHLDQKRPVYKNAPAHSAEYESPLVEREAKRIKQTLK